LGDDDDEGGGGGKEKICSRGVTLEKFSGGENYTPVATTSVFFSSRLLCDKRGQRCCCGGGENGRPDTVIYTMLCYTRINL
jgi:hypothetical protein